MQKIRGLFEEEPKYRMVQFNDGQYGLLLKRNWWDDEDHFLDLKTLNCDWKVTSRHFEGSCKGTLEEVKKIGDRLNNIGYKIVE